MTEHRINVIVQLIHDRKEKQKTELFYCGGHNVIISKRQRKQMGNQEQTIQRHWKHWAHKTQEEDKQNTKTTQCRKLQVVLYCYAYNENPNISLVETLKPVHKRSVMDIEDTNTRQRITVFVFFKDSRSQQVES